MQKIHEEEMSKMEAIAQELKLLKAEENDITKAIEVSTQKLASISEKINKAGQMMAKL